MIFSTTLSLALASALGAIAAPVENSGVQVIPAHRNPNYVFNGPAALRKTLAKYGRPIPTHLQAHINAKVGGGSGSDPANAQEQESEWTSPVTVGNTTMQLNIDTGFADLWVFSDLQSSTTGHTAYPCKGKKTFGQFGGGFGESPTVSGVGVKENVTIAGITVRDQVVGCAKTVMSQGMDLPEDGSLGLAFKAINTFRPTQEDTWMGNAVAQGLLKAPVFTADLFHGSRPSSFTFGKCTCRKPTWIAVDNSNGYYQINGAGFKSKSGKVYPSTSGAIVDSGTTLMLINTAAIKTWLSENKSFNATNDQSIGAYTFPCSAKPPSMKLSIGNSTVTVPGDLLNYGPYDDTKPTTCILGVADGQQDGLEFDVWGTVFLKAVTACFDEQNVKFGWCPKSSY